MKTIIQRVVAVMGIFAVFSVAAQTIPAGEDSTTAERVLWTELPTNGTFWVEGPSGFTAPFPFRPRNMPGASDYALSDGSFVVDARTVQNFSDESIAPPPPPQNTNDDETPSVTHHLLIVTNNSSFSEIVISNHTYVSLNAVTLGTNGNVMTSQLPYGGLFAVTATNLATPLTQWQPVGLTNIIGSTNFNLPYDPVGKPISFYRFCAELDTNDNPDEILPFSVMATNLAILSDDGVTLTWTNRQPGSATEEDAIVEMDKFGHSYLVGSEISTGAVDSFSFETQNATNLTFVRYPAPADISTDQFFLPTNNFNSPDVVTVPYVISTNSGRAIIEVAAYDVTDPSDPQFLGHVTGAGSDTGTVEIPGVSLWPGVDTLEFRAIDSSYGQTATDIIVTNYRPVSIVSPVLALETDGTNRIAASGGGYGISVEAVTTATTGTWMINVYDPAGNLFENASMDVTNVGQVITFDDGSTVDSVYPDPYYDVEVTVQPSGGQPQMQNNLPSPVNTQYIRVYLLPPKPNSGSITAYDSTVINELGNNTDEQYALSVLSGGVSQMFDFIYNIENIQNNGLWQTVGQPTANNLNAPFGWAALNFGLADKSYEVGNNNPDQTPDRPILGVMVHGHGGLSDEGAAGIALGVQGPRANDQLSVESLSGPNGAGFVKAANAVALAIFTGCRVGNSPFMEYILRNNGVSGQFTASTALTQKIRPCFGLGWSISAQNNTDIFDWLTYYTLYATENDGSTFTFTLDQSISEANQNAPGSGGNGVIWSGEQSIYLDALEE